MDLGTLQIRIQRSENLPVLPAVVGTVLKIVEGPNASAREVEKAVESDPAITAKILRVANSPLYGGAAVPTIGRAISVLGMNSIKSLVVGVSYQQMINGGACTSVNFNKLEFWQHSLAVATGARLLGKSRIPMRAEELYVAGMMHDVGILVLDRFMPDQLDIALRRSADLGEPLFTSELETYGFDHAAIGGVLALKWGLSPLVQKAVAFHHDPDSDGDYYDTTIIIAACNALAHEVGFRNSQGDSGVGGNPEHTAALGLSEEELTNVRDKMVEEVGLAQETFGM